MGHKEELSMETAILSKRYSVYIHRRARRIYTYSIPVSASVAAQQYLCEVLPNWTLHGMERMSDGVHWSTVTSPSGNVEAHLFITERES